MRGVALVVMLVAAASCGDRALDGLVDRRVDACDSWCADRIECLPVPNPIWPEATAAQTLDECSAGCVDSLTPEFELEPNCVDTARLELTECTGNITSCVDWRAAYFMDGEPSFACYDERVAMHECEVSIDLPRPFDRWEGVPTP